MSKISEIDPENAQWTRWRSTAVEWLAVILAGLALALSIGSIIISASSSLYHGSRISEQQDSLDVYRIRAAKLDAWLKAKGVPIEEVYGENTNAE